jgi:recombination associated protein RdgC
MFFKNLQIYRLPAPYAMTAERLAAALAFNTFTPATSTELIRQGWAPPRGAGMPLVHAVAGQFLMLLRTEKKLLPTSVVNQVAKARAAEMEEEQGFAPGKKAMKELKERVADDLLPRAFPIESTTWAWIDPVNGWLVVDAASPGKADDVIKLLLKAVDRMPLESLRVQRSPVAAMTEWLSTDEAPAGFTIDQDATMRATGESKAQVSYKRHTLEPDDVRRHIAAGKQCTRLAMTWDDKISFVLDESLAIKSVKALDVLTERDAGVKNDDERFDGDMMLMTGELSKMMADIVEALGGEAADLASPAGPVAAPARAVIVSIDKLAAEDGVTVTLSMNGQSVSLGDDEAALLGQRIAAARANGLPLGVADELYDKAVEVVRAHQRASISLVQRHLLIGYNRAAHLMDAMEAQGVISAPASNGAREVLEHRPHQTV